MRVHTGGNPLLDAGRNPLPGGDQFGTDFLAVREPLQANLSDAKSLDGDATPKRKEMDTLEIEQWPHVTGFKNLKTSLRREVITGSTRPRHATDWLVIHEAQAMQSYARVGRCRIHTRQRQDEF